MNYQKELEAVLNKLPDRKRTLLLHSCCAPCSSYVLEYLSQYFQITVYYYNPNISEKAEYQKRVEEQKRLITSFNQKKIGNEIAFLEGAYEPEIFYQAVKGLEKCREGGERCHKCFTLRLNQTALTAERGGFDYFATTLTISPLKNAEVLNQIGMQIIEEMKEKAASKGEENTLLFLPSDFKKKNGYKRSIELSHEYQLYRQDFCGCIFSKQQREEEKRNMIEKEK